MLYETVQVLTSYRFRGKVKKSCQKDPCQYGCRHLAENFLGNPNFLHPFHGHRRALESCESGILKLRTNLEIFASNPILKAHFFELGKNVVCKFLIF